SEDRNTLFLSEGNRIRAWDFAGKAGRPWQKPGWGVIAGPTAGIVVAIRSEFEGGGVFVLDARTGKSLRPLQNVSFNYCWLEQFTLSPDGKTFAFAELNLKDEVKLKEDVAKVRLWDTGTGKELASIPQPNADIARSIAIANDGRTAALGAYRDTYSVELWD